MEKLQLQQISLEASGEEQEQLPVVSEDEEVESPLHTIQGCAGRTGDRNNAGQPSYSRGGSLARCEEPYQRYLFNPTQRDGGCWNNVSGFLADN